MTGFFARSAVLAAVAVVALGTSASAETLGEQVSRGVLTERAFAQLIAGSGYSADEARTLTLEDIVAAKWQDS